jgi:hypothetical protein
MKWRHVRSVHVQIQIELALQSGFDTHTHFGPSVQGEWLDSAGGSGECQVGTEGVHIEGELETVHFWGGGVQDCSEVETVEGVQDVEGLLDLDEIFLFDQPKPEGERGW